SPTLSQGLGAGIGEGDDGRDLGQGERASPWSSEDEAAAQTRCASLKGNPASLRTNPSASAIKSSTMRSVSRLARGAQRSSRSCGGGGRSPNGHPSSRGSVETATIAAPGGGSCATGCREKGWLPPRLASSRDLSDSAWGR